MPCALSIVRQFEKLTRRQMARTRSGNGKLLLLTLTHKEESIRKGIGIALPSHTHTQTAINLRCYYVCNAAKLHQFDVHVCRIREEWIGNIHNMPARNLRATVVCASAERVFIIFYRYHWFDVRPQLNENNVSLTLFIGSKCHSSDWSIASKCMSAAIRTYRHTAASC